MKLLFSLEQDKKIISFYICLDSNKIIEVRKRKSGSIILEREYKIEQGFDFLTNKEMKFMFGNNHETSN